VDAYAAQMAVGVERLLQVARSNIKADS